MVWCSGWKFVLVVSNVGGLGLIGFGLMYFDVLCEYICKCWVVIDKFFGVNILLMYL